MLPSVVIADSLFDNLTRSMPLTFDSELHSNRAGADTQTFALPLYPLALSAAATTNAQRLTAHRCILPSNLHKNDVILNEFPTNLT